MTDEQQRIRGYLVAQAAKLSPADIVDKVRAAMADLAAAAKAVPPDRWAERPAPGEWSGNEVMAHVLAADGYFSGGIVAILDGDVSPPRPEGKGVEHAPLRTAAEWCDLLERQRAVLFTRVLQVDPSAHLDKTLDHPMFGALNWRETLLFNRLHDLDHAGQLGKNAEALK